jgi:hypothetical protein
MQVNTKTALNILVTWAFASLLTACGGGGAPDPGGGGGSSGTGTSNSTGGGQDIKDDPRAAAGLWQGSTSDGRQSFAVLLSDGRYWFFYTAVGTSSSISGVGEGIATSIGGTLTAPEGRDFNLEGNGVSPATLTATYMPQALLNGTIQYPNQTVSFTTSYVSVRPAALSQIAGSYGGAAAVVGASDAESVSLAISAGGAVAGTSARGCNFSGAATPRTDVAVFDLTLTFSGGACALGTSTVRGIMFYDANTGNFLSAAVNAGRTDALLAVGTKQ